MEISATHKRRNKRDTCIQVYIIQKVRGKFSVRQKNKSTSMTGNTEVEVQYSLVGRRKSYTCSEYYGFKGKAYGRNNT